MKTFRRILILIVLAAVLTAAFFLFFKDAPEQQEPSLAEETAPLPGYIPGPALECPAKPVSFSGDFSSTDIDPDLYRYDRVSLKSDVRLYAAGETLYLIGGGSLACINVATGGHSPAVSISSDSLCNYCAGTFDDGRLWIAVMDSAISLRIFDASAETLCEYVHTESGHAPCWCAAAPDGSFAALGYSGKLVICDLSSGAMRDLPCRCELLERPFIGADRSLVAHDTEKDCVVSVDLNSGAVHPVDITSGLFPLTDGLAVSPGDFDGTVSVKRLDGTGGVYFPGEGFAIGCGGFAADRDCLLRVSDGSIRLYALSDGRLLRENSFPDTDCDSAAVCSLFGWAACSSGGSLYVFHTDAKRLTDHSAQYGEYLSALPRDECGQLADYICRTHGVQCFWGAEGCSFDTRSFTGLPAQDADALLTLRSAADFFDSLPEGMLQEALAGVADGLCLYICRDLRTYPDLGWSASGFTDLCGGKLCMAVNTEDLFWMRGNIGHEFWHVLERRVKLIEQCSGAEYISTWAERMPDSVRRAYWSLGSDSLDNQWLSSSTYCANGENDPDRVWFVRDYSRSDPAEDRATVFEVMIYAPELLETYPHLAEKADRLCETLRFCYPSCSGADGLCWELYMNTDE